MSNLALNPKPSKIIFINPNPEHNGSCLRLQVSIRSLELPVCTNLPEQASEDDGGENSEGVAHQVVVGAPPVRDKLLPHDDLQLLQCGLRVRRRKEQILHAWLWHFKVLNHLHVVPVASSKHIIFLAHARRIQLRKNERCAFLRTSSKTWTLLT